MSAVSFFTISPCTSTPYCCPQSGSSSGGSSGGGSDDDDDDSSALCCPSHGNGSPEGVVTKPEGSAYVNDLTQDIYFKISGDDAFGWVVFVGASTPGVGAIFVVGSIAQARALPSLITNRILVINGDMTGGDGFTHNNYTWDQGSAADNNNGSVLQSTDLGIGRWLQN